MSPIFIAAGMAGAKSAYKANGRKKVYSPPKKEVEYKWSVGEGSDRYYGLNNIATDVSRKDITLDYGKDLKVNQFRSEKINPKQIHNDKAFNRGAIGVLAGLASAVAFAATAPVVGGVLAVVGVGALIKAGVEKAKAKKAPFVGYQKDLVKEGVLTRVNDEKEGKDKLMYTTLKVDGEVTKNSNNPTFIAWVS